MSLPDTVFIFVLALIIFGPKKLPEIGRQLGKLVGEFRRASNEFKFQIEEELRQVDILDKAGNRTTIAPSTITTTAEPSTFLSPTDAVSDAAANLPVGQHPNIDTLNTAELKLPAVDDSAAETANTAPPIPQSTTVPTITPAEGAEARTTMPYAAIPGSAEILNEQRFPITASARTGKSAPCSSRSGNHPWLIW